MGTTFSYNGVNINLALPGKYNFSNALSAVALAEKLGLSPTEIKAGIESVKPLGDRGNVFVGSFTVVKDCYNANFDSMKAAIEFYGSLSVKGKKTFILGDMLELGVDSKTLHEKIGVVVMQQKLDKVIFVGKEMTHSYLKVLDLIKSKKSSLEVESVETYDDETISNLSKKLISEAKPEDLFFLKGSRSIKLERIGD